MAQLHRGKGRRSGRQTSRHQKKVYEGARLQNEDDEFEPHVKDDVPADDAEDDLDNLSSEDDDDHHIPVKKQDAYAALLHSFGQTAPAEEPLRKKRKLNGDAETNGHAKTWNGHHASQEEAGPASEAQGDQTIADDLEEPTADVEHDQEAEEEDDEEDASDAFDAFDAHFANADDKVLAEKLKAVNEKSWHSQSYSRDGGVKWIVSRPGANQPKDEEYGKLFPALSTFKIKQKFAAEALDIFSTLDSPQQDCASAILSYKDVYYTARTPANSTKLRSITCLHALNHIFKTRDRVLKNNARLAQNPDTEHEYRDQGFTRPKALILLPTRQSCVRYVNTMASICKPEQQENKKRFEDAYSADEEMEMERPDDYKELFGGNNDDMFRIGVKFTRKTVKFFSQFYNSDLILASPLGLRQALGSGKKADADFLSSIEVLILDQADALAMQNWEHVLYVMERLNLQPKEAHGCDFSRVRMTYLEGQAKYLRQTILLSAHSLPQHLSLLAIHTHNIAGRAICQPHYHGVISTPQAYGIKQTFLRFPSPSLPSDPNARFSHFTSAILPTILRTPRNADGSGLGLLIYIPDSLDFPRLRNHFSFHPSCVNISFASVDENHTPASREVRRARSHFASGRHSILLYTERAHHFFRYKIKGVKKVVFYGVPSNPVFWEEVCGLVGDGEGKEGVKCIFSKWERGALERVVGSERVAKMSREKGGDVFEFV